MNKLLVSIAFTLLLTGCKSTNIESSDSAAQAKTASKAQLEQTSLESTFWNTLAQQCGSIYKGKSTFPSNPDDSFYGKTLVADFASCTASEIRVPFSVGDNTSRTWIFTKLPDGKVQLKHQHLHADGSVDEVSNYGGISDGGEIEINGKIKTLHVHFPADDFTKNLLPEASSNVWTIELTNADDNKDVLTYNLYRHNKKRFIAALSKIN